MTNVVRLDRHIDTLPCEVEFDRRVLTQIHIANAGPRSALDGQTPRKARLWPWCLAGAVAMIACALWRLS